MREHSAERAETREADLEAHLRNGELAAREEVLGAVEPRADAKLVRRHAENRFELANEMERRNGDVMGDVAHRRRLFGKRSEKVARPAETIENVA